MQTKKYYANLALLGGVVLAVLFVAFSHLSLAYAFEITDTNVDLEKNDFILETAKFEVFLDPGASETRNLIVTNRSNETKEFTIEVEDFVGSDARPVVLLGDERGPYSLRDYVTPEVRGFTLEPGQRITLPVTIDVPADAEPGGLYGSVLISIIGRGGTGASGSVLISRLGALFFVRVSGDVEEGGVLESFTISGGESVFYDKGPSGFDLSFRNSGSVHLNPYGSITIKNSLGVTIDELDVEPYFAMPDTLRYRKIEWDKKLLLGRYKATASINRGYDDIVDEMSLSFWVIPWKLLIGGFTVIVLIVLLVGWFISKFEIRSKKKKE